jgi:DNA polymerase
MSALERDAPIATSIAALRAEAAGCMRCPLYRNATRTVFGEGAEHARLMFVGEQPGDQEDRAGHPFVGPAGKIFDRALAEAGIDRRRTYVTSAVKHFKNEPRGKKRLHRRPNAYEISRCKWWLEGELAIVRPKLVIALGATAASALAGRAVAIGRERNTPVTFAGGEAGFITTHPSAILRMRGDDERHAAMALLVRDLKNAKAAATGK